jgi:hypothetical protein
MRVDRGWALRTILALALLVPAAAGAHGDGEGDLPVTHFPGGGSKRTDCLAGLEAVGLDAGRRARKLVCRDGDPTCDRDRLVNGRCEFWLRACVNQADPRCRVDEGVQSVVLDHDGSDFELVTMSRALALLEMPQLEAERCSALTTRSVSLGARRNGKAKTGRTVVRLTATGTAGTVDRDAVKLVCKPPARQKRKGGTTFDTIQRDIFQKQCAFSGCHSLDSPQGDLALEGDGVYDALVGVLASSSAAAFSGKRRVVPGAPDTSFLMDKLLGKLSPGEGDAMPLGRSTLPAGDIETIRKWILAGAPREKPFGGTLRGELDEQPRIPPPAAPDGGFQVHMDPFPLGDVPETEGCQFVRLGNDDPIFVGAWELFMHEGSHHFIVRAFRCGEPDEHGLTACDQPGFDEQFPTGFHPCEDFGFNWGFVVGAQTPHFQVDYQTASTGVGLALSRNQPLLLNSHYTNPFKETQAEAWVNVTPVPEAQVRHRGRILFEQLANVTIDVPPGERSAAASYHSCAFDYDPFCEAAGEPRPPDGVTHFALMGITSHMHKRAWKFVSDLFVGGTPVSRGPDDMTDPDDGSTHLYVSTEYTDPVNLTIWPPTIVEQGQRLTYTCFHDNGVTRPVRLGCEEEPGMPPGDSILEQFLTGEPIFDGAARVCRGDADCEGFGTGRCVPANLVFGYLAEDDMCILPGLYYRCPGDAASCLE